MIMFRDQKLMEKKWRELAAQAVELKSELGKYRLFKTMHKMEEVVTEIGYEIAENITGEDQQRPAPKEESLG